MLKAISPIDGRYAEKTQELQGYFSEYALIKYRVLVEIQYFIALTQEPLPQLADFNPEKVDDLNNIFEKFEISDAERIKSIERVTNHDVKAVEYYLKERWDALELSAYKEFIHFGLTSQDINNTATPMLIMHATNRVLLPVLQEARESLFYLAENWKHVPLLARTHGQAASPTLLGKEIMVYVSRLDAQLAQLRKHEYQGKFGGATGNFNAHHVAFPAIAWDKFGDVFLADYLGLSRQQYTTQIEHYDQMAALFQNIQRINTILIDLCRDVWTYVSMDYFKQKTVKNEVGSSAMPHKVNPIDFENAEGNFGMANAVFGFMAEKLPISRLQRDLTDSTVLRNVGVPYGHSLIAYKSLLKGLDKLLLNEYKLNEDLEKNWAVVAEAIQTILRRENYPQPYEALKGLTRGNATIDKQSIMAFIDSLDIEEDIKEELRLISPHNYTGIF